MTRSVAVELNEPLLVECWKLVMKRPMPSSAPVRMTIATMTSMSVMPRRAASSRRRIGRGSGEAFVIDSPAASGHQCT